MNLTVVEKYFLMNEHFSIFDIIEFMSTDVNTIDRASKISSGIMDRNSQS